MNLRLFPRKDIDWKKIIYFKWFKRIYFLYIFGCVLYFRVPSPFFYDFLLEKGFSNNAVERDIIPVLFYSTSVQLLPVFLLMEHCKYIPFIIIATLTGLVATSLYIWTDGLTMMQVAQGFYGSITAAETAYFISIYAHSNEKTHQRLTSYVRAAPLIGKTISALLSQLLIWQDWLKHPDLHYFNLSIFIITTILTMFLPSSSSLSEDTEKEETSDKRRDSIITLLTRNLKKMFPNKYVVKWTIWSILSASCYNLVNICIEPFWRYSEEQIDRSSSNGVIEGIYGLFAFIGTILGGFATFDWKYKGDLILSMTSLVQGFSILLMSQLNSFSTKCLFYVGFGFIYHFITTVLFGEIAKFLTKGYFGPVFGLITLAGSSLSSLTISLCVDNDGFIFTYQDLFMVYGFYYLGICVLFIAIGLSYWFAKHTYQ